MKDGEAGQDSTEDETEDEQRGPALQSKIQHETLMPIDDSREDTHQLRGSRR